MECPQLGSRLAGTEKSVVVPGATDIFRALHPPFVFLYRRTKHDEESRSRAEEQRDRKPEAEGGKHGSHRRERQQILQQPAETFEQAERAVRRLVASPVQTVVELGRIVEGEIDSHRLLVQPGMDVIG